MRTQWTTKGNRDAGSSCSCDRGLDRYLRNFGGGGVFEPPNPPPRYATAQNHDHVRFGRMNCKLLRDVVACYLILLFWTWSCVK